ncbi:MAG TPA: EAL domain-containing protein [Baekduia sp.]|nr:EAL domain-containing protein [Baekduia sp.]
MTTSRSIRPPARRVLWTVTLAAFAVYLVLVTAGQGTSDGLGGRLIGDWLPNAIFAASAGLALLGARRTQRHRRPWMAIAASLGLWAAGQVIWTLVYGDMATPPYPSISDAFWLACYPLYYLALVLLLGDRIRRLPRGTWLDGLIGTLALATFAAALLFAPLHATAGGDTIALANNLAYPIGDFVLILMVVAAYALSGGKPGRAWTLLGAGMLLNVTADWIYIFQAASGRYQEGTLLDATWVAATLFLAGAVWQPPRPAASVRFEGWRALAVPLGLSGAVLALLGVETVHRVNPVAHGFAVATLVCVIVRTVLALRDNLALVDTRRQALTDDLTGLANRRWLFDRLNHSFDDRRVGAFALLLLDLDRFKELNDTLGHHVGDLLLQQLGDRLRHELRDGDLIARLGGDEFAVLLRPGSDQAAAVRVAARLHTALERDFRLDGVNVRIDASIGIALAPDHGNDANGLLQRADVAMYQAKRAATHWEIYDPERDRHSRGRLALAGEIREALSRDQLVLHFQPQAELATGQITGAEALVRWQHPERGLLGPGEFVPIAEETGLVRPFTLRILDLALRQARTWCDSGLHLRIAVNISTHNLLDVELPTDVRDLLERHDVASELLQLEVTENAVLADPCRASDVLCRLRDLGVSVALDDFGTGYSSLAHLRRLAVDEIKIDRSFVKDMTSDPDDAAIARSTIQLAHSLNLRVVAEGVEDASTWHALRALHCDYAQGYHLARPLPADVFADWLADRHTAANQRPAIRAGAEGSGAWAT